MIWFKSLLLALVASASAGLAQAQTPDVSAQATAADDWEILTQDNPRTVAATIAYEDGLRITLRCQAGVYDAYISGLPEVGRDEMFRQISAQLDGGELSFHEWAVGSDRNVAFNRLPLWFARMVAKGGPLNVVIQGRDGGRRTRYVMDLPPSESSVARTLTACGRPLINPRQQILEEDTSDLPSGISWAMQPRPIFPSTRIDGYYSQRGYVMLTCVVQQGGRLGDCEVESEFPSGFNFGRAVLRSIGGARMKQSDEARAAGAPFVGKIITFSVNFLMDPI